MRMFLFPVLVLAVFLSCKVQNRQAETNSASNAPPSERQALVQRDQRTPGYIPASRPATSSASFPISQYEDPLPELDLSAGRLPHEQPGVRIIYPDRGCHSWTECGINDPKVRYFLITPGDYVDWGKLELSASGTDREPRILRYYDPRSRDPYHPPHPVKLAGQPDKEVVLENFVFDGADHWILHGLTFRGKGVQKRGIVGGHVSQIKDGADHNAIDYCLIEHFAGIAAIRIFESNYNVIQNSVIRDKAEGLGVDMGGIGISAGYQAESRGNRIVNNEIYNLTDAIGLIYNVARDGDPERSQVGEVPATIIENNDFYIEPRLYRQKGNETWACAEDGMDLKAGTKSTDPRDRIRILNNRLWGFRPTDQSCGGSGSTGAGIVIHRNASNILIEGNIFFDLTQGITAFGKNRKYPDEEVEHIAIINNLFYNLRDAVPGNPNSGQAFRLSTGVDMYYNTVAKARSLLFVQEKRATNRVQCNTFIDIREAEPWENNRQSWSNLNAWYNYPDEGRIYAHRGNSNVIGRSASDAKLGDLTFYVRRWTGPEKKTFSNVVPTGQLLGPKITPEQGCHCGKGGEGGRWWVE